MIEYYKDDLNTSGKKSELDDFTRYEFSFSGLECRILGAFYKDGNSFEFGAEYPVGYERVAGMGKN